MNSEISATFFLFFSLFFLAEMKNLAVNTKYVTLNEFKLMEMPHRFKFLNIAQLAHRAVFLLETSCAVGYSQFPEWTFVFCEQSLSKTWLYKDLKIVYEQHTSTFYYSFLSRE